MKGRGGGPEEKEDFAREAFAHFDRLAEMDEPSQERELNKLARVHPGLHARVLALLAAATVAESKNFLSGPRPIDAAPASPDFLFHAGDEIDVYRLDRPIGRGGMGEVWLAYRSDGAYKTPVALKLLHAHLAAGTLRARFVREGRILASLSHPNIARMLDAGVTAQGQHYLVIEYIEGQPVDRWCDERRLDIDARIGLFLQICAAVAYAHAHLVVHRDLKPSNILVAADGTVKLLDFGIAKLIEAEQQESDATELTRFGGNALTPDYAAPEQVLGEPVTTATDVYALGVLLYRLFTGRRPYGEGGKTAAQLAFDVLQTLPRAPSEAVAKGLPAGTGAEALAEMRGTAARNLSRRLRGDLDVIVAKALRKEPETRYRDARALAEDLQRHLDHQPVQAREGARTYVWRRFIRRNWLPLSAATALFLILLAGIASFAWQATQTRREAQRASAVTDFLIKVFRVSDPRIAQDKPRNQITARELLDRSADRITTDFAADPDTEIKLLGVTADIYRELDDEERYSALLGKQVELVRKLHGDLHPAVVGGLLGKASAAENKSNFNEALELLDQADPLIHRAGLDQSVTRARWLMLKGEALTIDPKRWSERQALLEQSAHLYERTAPSDPDYVMVLCALGQLGYDRADYPDSIAHYRRAIEAGERMQPRNDVVLLEVYKDLAVANMFAGHFADADTAFQKATDLALKTYGEQHWRSWPVIAEHARLVHMRGDRERSMSMFAHLRQLMAANPAQNSEVDEVRYNYAASLVEEEQPAPAIPILEDVERALSHNPDGSFTVRRTRRKLGDAYELAGRSEAARRYLKLALDEYAAEEAPDSEDLLNVREDWGRYLLEHGDRAGAEAQFREVVARAGNRAIDSLPSAWAGLARLALLKRDPSDALASAQHAAETLGRVTGVIDARVSPYVWRVYAEALLAEGDLGSAHKWAVQAFDADGRYNDPGSRELARAKATLHTIELAQARAAT
jgi:serine/threonine-protein kinase